MRILLGAEPRQDPMRHREEEAAEEDADRVLPVALSPCLEGLAP